MSSRTIDESGRDELKQLSSQALKIRRLEMALRMIRSWAIGDATKSMDDIKRKCNEALK